MSRINFLNNLKIKNETRKNLNLVETKYKKQKNKLEFKDKIAIEIYKSIKNIKTETQDEELQKLEYMINLNKIICDWEELRPVLVKYFEEKKLKDKNFEKIM